MSAAHRISSSLRGFFLGLVVAITFSALAATYNYFSPGGALSCSGSCLTQSVNLASGPSFITGTLPVANETPAGGATQVQYNQSGTLTGSSLLAWINSTAALSVGGATIGKVDLLNTGAPTDQQRTRATLDASGNFTLVPVNNAGNVIASNLFQLNRNATGYNGFLYQDASGASLSYATNDFANFAAPNTEPLMEVSDAGTTGALAGFSAIAGNGNSASNLMAYCQGNLSTLGAGLTNGPAAGYCQIGIGDQLFGLATVNTWPLSLGTNAIEALRLDASQNVVVHSKATSATTDTKGFLYTESVAGKPTGIPGNTYTNAVPERFDTTNNQICYYNSGWKCSPVTASGVLPVTGGGTGVATLTAHGVLLGEGASPVSAVAAMAADTLLQGQGTGSDPAAVAINNCGSATQALSYSTSTHTFGCQTLSATATVTATDIGYGSAGNALTGTADLTYTHSTQTLNLGDGTAAFNLVGAGKLGLNLTGSNTSGNPGLADTLTLTAGQNTTFLASGAVITVQGGQTSVGGAVNLTGGSTGSGGGGSGGAITLTSGGAASNPGAAGNITLSTGAGASGGNGSIFLQINGTTAQTITGSSQVSFTGPVSSAGSTFTASGCSNSALVGGVIAGQYTSGTTGTCTVTITLPAVAHGWACHASDISTPANLISQSAKTTTSCTLTGTTVTNDIIVFSAFGY